MIAILLIILTQPRRPILVHVDRKQYACLKCKEVCVKLLGKSTQAGKPLSSRERAIFRVF
jgi:hypothetical protein